MTIRLAAPFAFLALVLAAPTLAAASQGDHSSHTTAEAEAKPEKTRKVCRSETATGSVMPKRVCRTVAQMEQDERSAERFREQQNRMGSSAR